MGKAQKDVSRKTTTTTTTTTRGWGGVGVRAREPVRLIFKTKSSFRYTDSGIPCDWSILTAPVRTKVHYVDWKCDALAIRLHIRLF